MIAFGFSRSATRSEEHTSELQSRQYLVCRLLLEKKKIGPDRGTGHRDDVVIGSGGDAGEPLRGHVHHPLAHWAQGALPLAITASAPAPAPVAGRALEEVQVSVFADRIVDAEVGSEIGHVGVEAVRLAQELLLFLSPLATDQSVAGLGEIVLRSFLSCLELFQTLDLIVVVRPADRSLGLPDLVFARTDETVGPTLEVVLAVFAVIEFICVIANVLPRHPVRHCGVEAWQPWPSKIDLEIMPG